MPPGHKYGKGYRRRWRRGYGYPYYSSYYFGYPGYGHHRPYYHYGGYYGYPHTHAPSVVVVGDQSDAAEAGAMGHYQLIIGIAVVALVVALIVAVYAARR